MLRFFRRKYILIALGLFILAFFAVTIGLILYIQSPAFNALARRYISREISSRTGATVQLEGFHWDLLRRRFELDNLTIQGREPDSEEPLARFPKIEIGLNLRTLFQRKVNL